MNKSVRAAMALAVGVMIAPVSAHAQGIYVGLRGGAGVPTGDFSSESSSQYTLDNAKSGFGYGLDAGIALGMLGIYAGFDHMNFDCESGTCGSDGKYQLQGVAAGLRVNLPGKSMIRPWVKGGVTFNELKGGYGSGSQKLTTDRNPGYEVAAGLDIPILGILSLYPQARYVGQNLKYKIPGVDVESTEPETKANYMTFDLGLSVHNPLSGH